jgi:hypothetical protein
MMDIVYALGSGSLHDNFEIRYSLRSIEKHLSGVGNVFIVGELPDFLTNVIHIPEVDEKSPIWKDRNIFRKLLLACQQNEISESFLFFNDDHYCIDDLEADKIPYYYRENDMLRTITITRKDTSWKQSLINTREYLTMNGYDVKMFDMHTPIIYEKSKFLKLKELDWEKDNGYGIKSLYCNMHRIKGELHKDNRWFPRHENILVLNSRLKNKPFISTSPEIPDIQKKIIQTLFPNKSKYEQ